MQQEKKKENRGGARIGAGRKPKAVQLLNQTAFKPDPVVVAEKQHIEPASVAKIQHSAPEPESLQTLRMIMNDVSLDAKTRLDAAKALAPFEAIRKGDVGKKTERAEAAKTAGAGRFSASAPPKLTAVN